MVSKYVFGGYLKFFYQYTAINTIAVAGYIYSYYAFILQKLKNYNLRMYSKTCVSNVSVLYFLQNS